MAKEITTSDIDVIPECPKTLQKVDNDQDDAKTPQKSDNTNPLQQQPAVDTKIYPESIITNILQELDESQQAFLESCERDFANRYTTNDLDYAKLIREGIGEPPIVAPWYCKPRRNFDWTNHKCRDLRYQNESYRRDYSGHRYEPYPNQNKNNIGHSNHIHRNRYNRSYHRPAPYGQHHRY